MQMCDNGTLDLFSGRVKCRVKEKAFSPVIQKRRKLTFIDTNVKKTLIYVCHIISRI